MTNLRIAAAVLLAGMLTVSATRAAERPPVIGRNGGVSAGHPLTTAAAFEILLKGGNAFDAGVAGLLAGGVVEQDLYSLGGEGLVLVYPRSEGKVTSVVGQGWAPKGATIDWYKSRNKTLDGEGLDPAVIPGTIHEAFEWPRVQTLHFFGSFWPHAAGFNKLNIEAPISNEVFKELQRRGHDVTRIRANSISSCATAVILDPATNNRIAGADPRRDCYAMAY